MWAHPVSPAIVTPLIIPSDTPLIKRGYLFDFTGLSQIIPIVLEMHHDLQVAIDLFHLPQRAGCFARLRRTLL